MDSKVKKKVKVKVKALFYYTIKIKNILFRKIKKKVESKYLFILSPPYCGSTMLTDLLSTSKSVSISNPLGTKEGQTLPEVKYLMFDTQDRWNPKKDFDWEYIKKIWLRYWDISKPILIEKSPANILRAESIQKVFTPIMFLISFRDPYAQCESIIRRNNDTAEYAANFAIKSLKTQKNNIEKLKSEKLIISYEDLTEDPMKFYDELVKYIPELHDIVIDRKIRAHNLNNTPMKMRNLNKDKINKLSCKELTIINKIFMKNKKLLEYFNYEIIENKKCKKY